MAKNSCSISVTMASYWIKIKIVYSFYRLLRDLSLEIERVQCLRLNRVIFQTGQLHHHRLALTRTLSLQEMVWTHGVSKFNIWMLSILLKVWFVFTAPDVTSVVPPVHCLPRPVSTVRTAAGKALFENLYLPPLPPGVKPLNSFVSLQSSGHDLTLNADSRGANSRYVDVVVCLLFGLVLVLFR